MSRLRVRNPINSSWIDICQSEWYVRKSDNSGWRRMLPSHGMKARHGANKYWLNIDCETEDDCGDDDQYGGTPDGRGDNDSGPDLSGGPSGPDPWDDWGSGGGGSGGGDGGFWNDDGGRTGGGSGGGGYGSNPVGGGSGGFGGGGSGVGSGGTGGSGSGTGGRGRGDENGRTGGGDTNTSDGDGTFDSAYPCGTLIKDTMTSLQGEYEKQHVYYIDMPKEDGNLYFTYLVSKGEIRFRVSYGDELIWDSGKMSSKKREFLGQEQEVQPVSNELRIGKWSKDKPGYGKVRVEVTGSKDGTYLFELSCPGISYNDRIKPCSGKRDDPNAQQFVSQIVSNRKNTLVFDTLHDMGEEKGVVGLLIVPAQSGNAPRGQVNGDVEVHHMGNKIAVRKKSWVDTEVDNGRVKIGTNNVGNTAGVGVDFVEFDYEPQPDQELGTLVRLRWYMPYQHTSHVYKIFCPGGEGTFGTPENPKNCGPETSRTVSGGAGVTDTYFHLGDEAGLVVMRYNTFSVPDQIDVFQNNMLIAGTDGMVTGEGDLGFYFDPDQGSGVTIRVTGEGETTWAFYLTCPSKALSCGESYAGTDSQPVFVDFGRVPAENEYAFAEYATVDSGVAPEDAGNDTDRLRFYGNARILEDTYVPVARFEDLGQGNMPLYVEGMRGFQFLFSEGAENGYRRAGAQCPIRHAESGTRFTNFHQGLSKLNTWYGLNHSDAGPYTVSMKGQDEMSEGDSAFMAVNMMHTSTGEIEIKGWADDVASIILMPDRGPIWHMATFAMETRSTTHKISPGSYFVYALVENVPHGTPSSFALTIRDTAEDRIILVASSDWYGGYFYPHLSFDNNKVEMLEGKGYIFDDDAQAHRFMQRTPAKGMRDVFDSWDRTDGLDTYTPQDAQNDASHWQYDAPNNTVIQPRNVAKPNTLITKEESLDYFISAVLSSNDGDDDAIGLVGAAKIENGVPSILAVVRTKGDAVPKSGFGVVYVGPETDGKPVVLLDLTENNTPDNMSGGWNGATSRLELRRSGDALVIQGWTFDNQQFQGRTYYMDDHEYTKKFKGASRFGFYTHSQPGSTYHVVTFSTWESYVFSKETKNSWVAQNGNWVDNEKNPENLPGEFIGSVTDIGTYLGWPRLITNPDTGKRYYTYRYSIREAP